MTFSDTLLHKKIMETVVLLSKGEIDAKALKCPSEKEKAIMDALQYFRIVNRAVWETQ